MKNQIYFIILIIFSNTFKIFIGNETEQIPWNVLNIKGYSIDPNTGKIDDTEGFGAIDSIMELAGTACPRIFDNGGGEFDEATKYLKYKYNVENIVYDPYMRSKEYNEKILKFIKEKPADCVLSASVLNVIDKIKAIHEHIKLCFDAVKENGLVFYKVWSGNGSGIPTIKANSYQSNKDATHYIEEIEKVFGKENVFLINNKTIKAIKRSSLIKTNEI